MRLAVADVERAIGSRKQPVRTRELALQRIVFGTVASRAGAKDRRDRAAVEIDATNRVILGVGEIESRPDSASPFGPARRASRAGPPSPEYPCSPVPAR